MLCLSLLLSNCLQTLDEEYRTLECVRSHQNPPDMLFRLAHPGLIGSQGLRKTEQGKSPRYADIQTFDILSTGGTFRRAENFLMI
jgi:hypothetical protein